MIREWLELDGTTARFDTVSKIIEFLDSDGVNVVPTHQATEEEMARVLELFPEVGQDVINRRTAISSTLLSTLNLLRQATSDRVVTQEEFASLNPAVVGALTAYRDYPDSDPGVDKMVILLLTQVNFAYSMLLAQGAANALSLQTLVLDQGSQIDELREIIDRNEIT